MEATRQRFQMELALESAVKGEAPSAGARGVEACMARACAHVSDGHLVEAVEHVGGIIAMAMTASISTT